MEIALWLDETRCFVCMKKAGWKKWDCGGCCRNRKGYFHNQSFITFPSKLLKNIHWSNPVPDKLMTEIASVYIPEFSCLFMFKKTTAAWVCYWLAQDQSQLTTWISIFEGYKICFLCALCTSLTHSLREQSSELFTTAYKPESEGEGYPWVCICVVHLIKVEIRMHYLWPGWN